MSFNRVYTSSRGGWLLLAVVVSLHIAFAQTTPGVAFLKMTAGSRAQAMGDAYTAVAQNAAGMYYNPAGMGFGGNRELMLFHSQWFEDISMENLTFMFPFSSRWSIGGGVSYLHMPEMIRYEIDPVTGGPLENGTFSVYDMVLTTGLGFRLTDHLSLGTNFKFFQEQLESVTASGMAFDVGLLAKMFSGQLNFGFAVQHLGPSVQYIEAEERLPLTYRGGVAARLPGLNSTFAFDVVKTDGGDIQYLPGLEFSLLNSFYLRGGYQMLEREGNGVTAGFGLKLLDDHHVNYVYVPYGDLGDTHRAELVFSLGSPDVAKPTYIPATRTSEPTERVRDEIKSATREVTPPRTSPAIKTPTNVRLLRHPNNKIELRWDAQNVAGIQYNIYARPSAASKWIRVTSKPISVTSQTFNPRNQDLNLEFAVTAVMGEKESDFSVLISTGDAVSVNRVAEKQADPVQTPASPSTKPPTTRSNVETPENTRPVLRTPTGLRLIELADGKMKLTWNKVAGRGVTYLIYARPVNTARWIKVTSEALTENSQVFNKKKSGVTLEFAITAQLDGEESDFSKPIKFSR